MSVAQRLKDLALSESGFVFDPVTGLTFDITDRNDIVRDLSEFVRTLKDQGILSRDAEV